MDFKELKKLAKTVTFRAEMRNVFFEAMNARYAATEKPKKGTIVELPGSKLVPPYLRGLWKVVDVYLVTPLSTVSGGMTIISYEDVPVWMMQYFGEYDEVFIPCLKAALRAAYKKRQFFGGRGPEHFGMDRSVYTYLNKIERDSDFNHFGGIESVYSNSNFESGWHSYQGGIML